MEGQGENDELYPIAVLIDELKVPNTSPGLQHPTPRLFSTVLTSLSL